MPTWPANGGPISPTTVGLAGLATSTIWIRGWGCGQAPACSWRWRQLPILATIVVLAGLAIVLAGRRDLGASVLPTSDTAAPRTRLLNGPLGLATRLGRGTALGWIAGLGGGGLVLGLSTKTMQDVWANQSGGVFARLGGASGGATYLGLVFLIVALLVGVAAAGQVAATREEEAEGYLDHLLARPVARLPWLAGRFAVAAAVLVGAGVLTGLLTWVGAASTGAHVRLTTVLAAGVNVIPAGIFVLGIGTLLHGLAPRFAAVGAYCPGGVVVPGRDRRRRPRRQPLAHGHLAAAPPRPRTGSPGALGQPRHPDRHRARHRRHRSDRVRPPRKLHTFWALPVDLRDRATQFALTLYLWRAPRARSRVRCARVGP